MKKPYEKPQLIALSLKANDALCACDVNLRLDPRADEWYHQPGMFGDGEAQCTIEVGQYCKYTATTNILINS